MIWSLQDPRHILLLFLFYFFMENDFPQTVLALRVSGGFSNDLGGDLPGQRQVYGRAFLMQIICIRDIYPSKTNGKQQVAKIYPHKTQCLRDSTLAKHSVLEAPMSKTHSEITCCKNGSPQNTVIQQLDPRTTQCFRSSNVKNT